MNILLLCAHPDDMEYNCAGTLLKYRRAGHQIYLALTTSGNTGSNRTGCTMETARIREAEQQAAARFLDAKVRFLRFDDEGLRDTPETRRAVLTAIRWANPDILFTNSHTDGSTDHAMTSNLVVRALLSCGGRHHNADLPPIQKKPQVFFFSSAGALSSSPRAFVDVSDVVEEQKQMLRCHRSQYEWMDTFDSDMEASMLCTKRLFGIQAGCAYAEGFTALDFPGYRGDYRLLP